jgi:hypothetical protein
MNEWVINPTQSYNWSISHFKRFWGPRVEFSYHEKARFRNLSLFLVSLKTLNQLHVLHGVTIYKVRTFGGVPIFNSEKRKEIAVLIHTQARRLSKAM